MAKPAAAGSGGMQRYKRTGPPEKQCACAAQCFGAKTGIASEYAVSASLQRTQGELTRHALHLLAMRPPALVLDCGCGTGFSSATIQQAGFACVGVDLSMPMLQQRSCSADVVAADMASLPFRQCSSIGLFDAVVSVSALQWLRTATALGRFFEGLVAVLTPGGRGVLQWYPEDPAHGARAEAAARGVGLAARLVCSFPHKDKQRKFFLCVQRATGGGVGGSGGAGAGAGAGGGAGAGATSGSHTTTASVACPLAWPYNAACAFCWSWPGEGSTPPFTGCALVPDTPHDVGAHLVDVHAAFASRLLRLQRRVDAKQPIKLTARDAAMVKAGIGARVVKAVEAPLSSGSKAGSASDMGQKAVQCVLQAAWETHTSAALHSTQGAWSGVRSSSATTTTSTSAGTAPPQRGTVRKRDDHSDANSGGARKSTKR